MKDKGITQQIIDSINIPFTGFVLNEDVKLEIDEDLLAKADRSMLTILEMGGKNSMFLEEVFGAIAARQRSSFAPDDVVATSSLMYDKLMQSAGVASQTSLGAEVYLLGIASAHANYLVEKLPKDQRVAFANQTLIEIFAKGELMQKISGLLGK